MKSESASSSVPVRDMIDNGYCKQGVWLWFVWSDTFMSILCIIFEGIGEVTLL
jgi:hypothetical protein